VADTASIVGDVHLGDGSSVWFSAVLRGDYGPIRIGRRTNIQDNAVVHIASDGSGTTIGDDVTIGHGAVVHACTLGDACLIGIGSIVLDGAEVGAESFVAAGSLVTPGTTIPPRSFVLGRPARVLRLASDAEVTDIRQSAARYVEFAIEFRGGLGTG
jgi:carbonic anhydrase/acetyltransferase-like protein (isoleucine patch superfamily)